MCVENSKSYIRIDSATLEPFWITSGLKQGDAMSPVLYKIALDKAVRVVETTMQMLSVGGSRLLLSFADYIHIMVKSTIAVKELFVKFERETKKMSLRVNVNKESTCVSRDNSTLEEAEWDKTCQ